MRQTWWRCEDCQTELLRDALSPCARCGSENVAKANVKCAFDLWDESWDCGCDYHFHDSSCPSEDFTHGDWLHCSSAEGHNFSHNAWYQGKIVYWKNDREDAYDGMESVLEGYGGFFA